MKYYLLTVLLNLFLPENTISCNRSVTNMMYYYACRLKKKMDWTNFFKEVFWLKWNFFLHLYSSFCYKTSPIEVDHTYKNYLEFSVDFDSNQKKTITVLFLISSIFPNLRKYCTQKINAFNEKLFDTLMAINNCNT